MTGLFDPERHEPLQAASWSEGTARDAIRRIADDALLAYIPGVGWRAHPLDDPQPPISHFHNLYFGSGGVIWALRFLARQHAIGSLPDFTPFVETLRDANRPLIADSLHGSASYLFGDTGLDLLHWTMRPSKALSQRLFEAIEGNLHNPVREALWGNSGTMLAAIRMAEATGDVRWSALVADAANALQSDMELDPETGTWLWVQNLYGRPPVRYLGAGHGFAGNIYPFLRAGAHLPSEQVRLMVDRALATLTATGLRASGGTNWFAGIKAKRPADWLPLVQDCHGAPGIICRMAGAPRTSEWDALLLEAGKLTWDAGPLRKGASLCHGTSGSGFAMLKLWRRSGDATWLERARALAMHGWGQVERHRAAYGQGRYSLWTGDLGLAVLLWNCIEGSDSVPTLDVF